MASAAVMAMVVLGVVLAAVDWWAVVHERRRIESVLKPSVMVVLLVLAATVDLEPASTRPWILAALAFGLVGDVLLLPTVDVFVGGLAAFLVGHLCYLVAMVSIWSPSWWLAVGGAGVLGLVVAFGRPVLDGVRGSPLVGPVGAYLVVTIALMVAGTGTGRNPIALGALAFATSDGLIGLRRFVPGAPPARLAVMMLYHLGQASILAGFAG